MDLNPPPIQGTDEDIYKWIQDLYDYLKFPAIRAYDIQVGDVENSKIFNVEADGDAVFIGAGTGFPYGEIYFHGAGSDIVLAAQDTWYQITVFNVDGQSNLTTVAHGTDDITIQKTGIYLVSYSAAIRSAQANSYEISVFKNNGDTEFLNLRTHRSTSVANRLGAIASSGICSLTANDTIELWVQRVDGGAVSKTITFEHCILCLHQIGG